MAKVTAPLLSFGGSGAIAKTQVYSSWRGVPYARRYVVPANPNSTSQQDTRGVFSWLNGVWKQLDPSVQSAFTLFSKGRPFFNRNAFISKNLGPLRGTDISPATDLSGGVMSPGANGGLAAAGITSADAGTHGLTVGLTAPTLPTGWTITKAHFVVFVQQDAHSSTEYSSHYMNDNTDPYSVTFAAIGAATYACFAFFEFLKPDGTTAYSPSLYAQQVVA